MTGTVHLTIVVELPRSPIRSRSPSPNSKSSETSRAAYSNRSRLRDRHESPSTAGSTGAPAHRIPSHPPCFMQDPASARVDRADRSGRARVSDMTTRRPSCDGASGRRSAIHWEDPGDTERPRVDELTRRRARVKSSDTHGYGSGPSLNWSLPALIRAVGRLRKAVGRRRGPQRSVRQSSPSTTRFPLSLENTRLNQPKPHRLSRIHEVVCHEIQWACGPVSAKLTGNDAINRLAQALPSCA